MKMKLLLFLVFIGSSKCVAQSIISQWNPIVTTLTIDENSSSMDYQNNEPLCSPDYLEFSANNEMDYVIYYYEGSICATDIVSSTTYLVTGNTLEIYSGTFQGSYEILILSTDQLKIRKSYMVGEQSFIEDTTFNRVGSLSSTENIFLEVGVYPNPTNDVVNIVNSEGSKNVKLFDVYGRKVLDLEINESSFNLHNIKAGVYFLLINNNSSISSTKLIVK